jgi:hypothetical protein
MWQAEACAMTTQLLQLCIDHMSTELCINYSLGSLMLLYKIIFHQDFEQAYFTWL